MKKLVSLAILGMFGWTTAVAQVSYLRSDFGVIGDNITYIIDTNSVNEPRILPGMAGNNRLWTFGTPPLPIGPAPYDATVVFSSPTGKPNANLFPGATLHIEAAGIAGFYREVNDTLYLMGGVLTGAGVSKAVPFRPAAAVLKFPVVLNQTFSGSYQLTILADRNDIAAATGQSAATIGLVLDSIEIKTTSTYEHLVDGFGTLVVKGDTLRDVFRVKRITRNVNNLRSKTRSLPFGPYTWQNGINVTGLSVPATTRDTSVQYSWYPKLGKYSALDFTSNLRDTTGTIRYIKSCALPANSLSGPTQASINANVQYSTTAAPTGARYNWSIVNGTIQSGQGTNTVTVRWAANGRIVLRVTGQDGCEGFAARNVSATTTAVDRPLTEAGWNLYPNPAQERTQLTGRLDAGQTVNLYLLDVAGRRVWNLSRELNAGEFSLDLNLNSVAQGLYTLVIEGDDFRYHAKLNRN